VSVGRKWTAGAAVSRETAALGAGVVGAGEVLRPVRSDAGPAQAGPVQAGRAHAGLARAGRAHAGLAQAGPTQAGPAQAGPAQAEDGVWTPIADEAERAARVLHPDSYRLPRPSRRRLMTVANQKGGVGKTTSAVNVAAGLALHGLRVLVVDLDPQGNASTALSVEHRSGTASVYEVLLGDIGLGDAVQVCPHSENLLCVPATIDLAGAEIELVSMVARESRLKEALVPEAIDRLDVDYVLIDCPPSLGLLTVNAMVAADEVFIPIQCEYYALEGLGQLLGNIELVQQHLNPSLTISTILLTMYDGRTKLADQVTSEVRRHFGDVVLRTVIPRSVKVSEAPGFGQTVLTYDPGSRGAMSYLDAAREIAMRGGGEESA